MDPRISPDSAKTWSSSRALRRGLVLAGLTVVSATAFAACGGGDSPGDNGDATGAGTGGSSGKAGTGGTAGKAGASGNAGKGGGINPTGGSGGATGGSSGTSGTGGTAGTAGKGGGTGGAPPVDGDVLCTSDTPDATIPKGLCRTATDNECDGKGLPTAKPEGTTGNGFDDDCDGLVDEGCECPTLGGTKDCYLMPSTQTQAPNFQVVGWCEPNAKGKEECIQEGSGEFTKLKWGGQCKGALPPYNVDVCQKGDYDCDGVEANPPKGCACEETIVTCPKELFATPFPNPKKVGQLSKTQGGTQDVDGVDGSTWINAKVVDPKSTYDWRWTVTGAICDDILPHPTFAVFKNPDSTAAPFATGHLGVETEQLPETPMAGQPDPATPKGTKQGYVVKGAGPMDVPAKIYPAFSLSGDYYVTGKFKYKDPQQGGKEVDAQCTQVVKVRAPGLRVELCWPEVGNNKNDNDVDLHLARLQGNAAGAGKHGWFTTAGTAPAADDCYYSPSSACGNRFNAQPTPGWYTNEVTAEPGGTGVCHGWGSRRFDGSLSGTSARPCTSPRLDRDNIACNPAIDDPNAPEKDPQQQGDVSDNFCGPENINLDSQVLKAGDKFAVGVECYNCVSGANGAAGAKPAHPRVNIYCDGQLKTGFGYDPAKLMSTPDQYPQLWTEGQNTYGSMWQVGVITWKGDPKDPCGFENVLPAAGKWNKDQWHQKSNGSPNYCVNNGPQDNGGGVDAPPINAANNGSNWKFKADGSYPTAPGELCSN